MPGAVNPAGNINYFEDANKKAPSNEMDADMFLKLLMAQMKNQDPTNPMNDTEFISQMATFNALEQQIATNKNLESLIQLNASSAVGYIGRLVGFTDGEGNPQAKVVQFVDFMDGKPRLNFEDGGSIYLDQVEQIG